MAKREFVWTSWQTNLMAINPKPYFPTAALISSHIQASGLSGGI